MESPVRQLVRSMATHAKALRDLADEKNLGLQGIYNTLCDVLDALNKELEEEDTGMLAPDWRKFSSSGNVQSSNLTKPISN
jgi:hypothetical protein